MTRKLCVLFLLFLAVVLVISESSIEVDGNGNEYDVKRFNVQGRQLTGAPHCVVSRRRRDTSAYGATAAVDEENPEPNTNVEESIAEIYAAEPSGAAPTATLAPDTDEDENAENANGETEQEVDLHDSALAAQYQGGVQSAAVAAAAAENGIVVVHSHDPPKVNGQTHAVFELLPVHPDDGPIDGVSDAPYDYVDDDDILQVNEETNPVTTTAIWSTGEGDEPYDEYDANLTTKKPKKKKQSAVRPTRRPLRNKSKKPKRKSGGKKKNKNKSGNRPVRRRPSQKRPAHRPSNTNRRPLRRRPAQSNANRRVVMKNRNQNRNGFKQQQQSNNNYNNNKRINANINHQNRNRKKNRPLEDVNEYTFTNTVTETDDGNDDKDRDVNCIIINKDPVTTTTTTTTTARPFWNILGRDAGNVPAAGGRYGSRKRVGIRFVA